jgi:hypothetical protein
MDSGKLDFANFAEPTLQDFVDVSIQRQFDFSKINITDSSNGGSRIRKREKK